jgi:HicB family
MDLTAYVDALRDSLRTAAAAGGEQAQHTARLLADTMEPAVRLAVLDALSAMAAEVTAALDGDVVEIRVRGRDPEVVVTPGVSEPAPAASAPGPDDADDGATARISLRLPDALKTRAEAAAAGAGTSLNTWLVRAVATAVNAPDTGRPSGRGPHRYSGFARS